jgi:hypothetical protein
MLVSSKFCVFLAEWYAMFYLQIKKLEAWYHEDIHYFFLNVLVALLLLYHDLKESLFSQEFEANYTLNPLGLTFSSIGKYVRARIMPRKIIIS